MHTQQTGRLFLPVVAEMPGMHAVMAAHELSIDGILPDRLRYDDMGGIRLRRFRMRSFLL